MHVYLFQERLGTYWGLFKHIIFTICENSPKPIFYSSTESHVENWSIENHWIGLEISIKLRMTRYESRSLRKKRLRKSVILGNEQGSATSRATRPGNFGPGFFCPTPLLSPGNESLRNWSLWKEITSYRNLGEWAS